MESSASWAGVLWYYSLVFGFFASLTIGLILWTLPSSYSHFHPRTVAGDTFSETQRKDVPKSGFQHVGPPKHEPGSRVRFDASVQIVVLGDIGRSPRMQYHALSIAQHGGLVDLIGYAGSDVHPDILRSGLITLHTIAPWPASLQPSHRLLFLLLAPFKVLWQVGSLYVALAYRTEASKWMLVQNPPSIPTLLVAQLVCFFRNTRLVIDWHNFGYTILALRLGKSHPFVRLAKWYEGFFAQGASAHFCVTHAMARVLKAQWGVSALPLHDRPPPIFQPLSPTQRREFLARLPVTAARAEAVGRGEVRLVVSSTSWTADENFGILLDALVAYETEYAKASSSLPQILAIITGRGPQRDHYLARIAGLRATGKLAHVEIETAWLTPADYAGLLGAADLGVSLHTSSSGVDLPMKVVDMFGAGLPVVGWGDFEAWGELVQEGINGRGFRDARGLTEILVELFAGAAKSELGRKAGRGQGKDELAKLREGAQEEGARRWEDEWMPVAGRLFQFKE